MVVNNLSSIYFLKVLTHIVVAAGSNCCCLRVSKRFIQQYQHLITQTVKLVRQSSRTLLRSTILPEYRLKHRNTSIILPRMPKRYTKVIYHVMSYLWHVIFVIMSWRLLTCFLSSCIDTTKLIDVMFTKTMQEPNNSWQLWDEVIVEEPPSLCSVF